MKPNVVAKLWSNIFIASLLVHEYVRSHLDWREERGTVRTLAPEGGWIVRSHIDWRGKRVPARMLSPKGR